MEAHALVARLPVAAAAAAPPVVRLATSSAAPSSRSSTASGEPLQLQLLVPQPEQPEADQAQAKAHDEAASTSGRTSSVRAANVATNGHIDAEGVLADITAAAAVPFPFLCLLVSGGHNLLVLVRDVGKFVQIGTTLDDALGELRGLADVPCCKIVLGVRTPGSVVRFSHVSMLIFMNLSALG